MNRKQLIASFLSAGMIFLLYACGGDNTSVKASDDDRSASSVASKKGATVFMSKCSMCHDFKDKRVGPALSGVHERWGNDEARLKAFIRNSRKVIQSGDAYANQLFQEWNKADMPNFEYLSDEDMDALLEYLK